MATVAAALIQAERDALACVGLLAGVYVRFDVPVSYPGESAPSHCFGLNIHAALVDNADGELLALDRNTIHGDGSPVQHGEQRALRAAITRVGAKRPRQPTQSIEAYYRSSMFMGPGSTPEDYLNVGATLYTTLEPCPMCASTALVCRVKRVIFLIADHKYGGAWSTLKQQYYQNEESIYAELAVGGQGSSFADSVALLYTAIIVKADAFRISGIRDTLLLDFCRDELQQAFDLLLRTSPSTLQSVAGGDARNAATLAGFQRALNMPHG